jgi:hypothetical protein
MQTYFKLFFQSNKKAPNRYGWGLVDLGGCLHLRLKDVASYGLFGYSRSFHDVESQSPPYAGNHPSRTTQSLLSQFVEVGGVEPPSIV